MIRRLGLLGPVDAEGNPNPELKSALDRLTQMGLSIANDSRGRDCTAGVVIGDLGACGVVKAPASAAVGTCGPSLRTALPGPPASARASYRSAAIRLTPRLVSIMRRLSSGPRRTSSRRFKRAMRPMREPMPGGKGIDDADAFVEASRDCGMGATRCPAYFTDCKQAEPSYKYGWRYHEIGSGSFRARRAIVFPKPGIILSECNAYAEALLDSIPDM